VAVGLGVDANAAVALEVEEEGTVVDIAIVPCGELAWSGDV